MARRRPKGSGCAALPDFGVLWCVTHHAMWPSGQPICNAVLRGKAKSDA